jgi:hypothetical protein
VPTVVTRYVHTGSTAGGDGTTNATTGANRAWPSFNHAIGELNTAYSSNLVTADVQIDLVCLKAAGVDDTTALTNAMPTSDTTRYINWQVPVADRKVEWDDNVYTYGRGPNFAGALHIGTNSFRMTGVQLYHSGSLNVGGNHGILITSAGGEWIFDGPKIIKSNNVGRACIATTAAEATTYVFRNCILGTLVAGGASFGWDYGLAIGVFGALPSNTTVLAYNNTVVHCGTAIAVTFAAAASSAVVRRKNNLIQGCTTGFTITNATTDDAATNHVAGTTATFVHYGTHEEILRLTAADTVARNLGTDLSGVADWPFSIDADQTTRPVGSAWDIGAHEQTTPNTPARAFVMMMGP